jgi:hypothetical protein
MMLIFEEAKYEEDYGQARTLFRENAFQLKVDLSFQNFSQKLSSIREQYSRPDGILVLAYTEQDKPFFIVISPSWA